MKKIFEYIVDLELAIRCYFSYVPHYNKFTPCLLMLEDVKRTKHIYKTAIINYRKDQFPFKLTIIGLDKVIAKLEKNLEELK